MVSIEGVQFQYGDGMPMQFTDFLAARRAFAIAGRFWHRQNHLLHLLCGMLRANEGTIQVAGRTLGEATDQELDVWRGSGGHRVQRPHFVQSLTVEENLLSPSLTHGEVPTDVLAGWACWIVWTSPIASMPNREP